MNAKEAKQIADQINIDVIGKKDLGEILESIKVEAGKGKYRYVTGDYGFGDGKCYTVESNYPERCKYVLMKLRELGYNCRVCSLESQFVDMYLEVTW